MTIRWGAAARPKQGQEVSGDAYLVIEHNGSTLVAIIDGLGGGAEAARAAIGAVQTVESYVHRPLKEIMERCHTALHGTRGAVMGLLRLSPDSHHASYMGVGNTGIHVLSAQTIKPISRNGILGHRQLPSLLELNYTYDHGDTFILYTDGISTRFMSDTGHIRRGDDPEALAATLLKQYGKTSDDATVVVLTVD